MITRLLTTLAASALVAGSAAAAQSHTAHGAHTSQQAAARPAGHARVLAPQPAVGDIPLIDHDGRPASLREILATDGPVMLNFIFTSCTTICPVMTTGFAQFQAGLGPERDAVRLFSISVDPEIDTAEVLRGYADRYGAGSSWRFLTGTPEAVEAAQRAFGAFRGSKTNHLPTTFFRRSAGEPWQALDGLSSADALARAYRGELTRGSF